MALLLLFPLPEGCKDRCMCACVCMWVGGHQTLQGRTAKTDILMSSGEILKKVKMSGGAATPKGQDSALTHPPLLEVSFHETKQRPPLDPPADSRDWGGVR